MFTKLEECSLIKETEFVIYGLDLILIDSPVIFNGWIYIKDSIIMDFGSLLSFKNMDEFKQRFLNIQIYDGSSYKVCASFIDSHTHCAMSFFRGLGVFESYSNKDKSMIENFLFPVEQHLEAQDVATFSLSYLIDGIKSGTSCFCDHYYFIESVADSMLKLGVKGVVGQTLADLNGAFLTDEKEWNRVQDTISNWPYPSSIKPALAAHATDTVSKSFLQKIVDFSKSLDLNLHIHLSQTKGERQRVCSREGVSPVKFLDSLGGITPKSVLVHLLSIDDDDLKIIRENQASMCICPSSEIIYETMFKPEIFETSGNVVVGSDCAASCDAADLLSELKILALCLKIQGISTRSPYFNAQKLLSTITTQPSKTWNLNCGQIKKGFDADLCFIKKDPSTAVDFEKNVRENLIFSSNSKQIDHLCVDGKFILWNKKITTINEQDVYDQIDKRFKQILKKVNF